jgi:hypothetical protein
MIASVVSGSTMSSPRVPKFRAIDLARAELAVKYRRFLRRPSIRQRPHNTKMISFGHYSIWSIGVGNNNRNTAWCCRRGRDFSATLSFTPSISTQYSSGQLQQRQSSSILGLTLAGPTQLAPWGGNMNDV